MGLLDQLSSFAQGASNSVAGTVSAPVDGIAWLLNKAGMNIKNPVGGSDWMAQQGLTAVPKEPMAGLLGEGIGGVLPMVAAAKAPQIADGLLQVGRNTLAGSAIDTGAANGGLINSSKSVKMYDPKPLLQRPFYDDYSKSIAGPNGSQLGYDIEGRPLVAQYIAGRRAWGAADEAMGAGSIDAAARELGVGAKPALRSGPELKGDAGRYTSANGQRNIHVDQSLPDEMKGRVYAHELGHAIDDMAFSIPTDGIKKELATIYENMNTGGWYKPGRGMTPQGQGYSGSAIGQEHIAEAIRAYMTDPNYIKSVAPNTAARIRQYVNTNPNLKNTIQFNGAAGGLLLADDSDQK